MFQDGSMFADNNTSAQDVIIRKLCTHRKYMYMY